MNEVRVFQDHLPNGLHLLGEYNPNAKSAALGFFVRTGSRDEERPESGVSHFLEHMMFKGTAKRKALDITFDLGRIGAQANAFTSEENTVYYGTVIPRYFSALQELLSDMLRPALDSHEFDTEKGVILEEIALYQDRPNFYLFEKAMGDYFSGHKAGNSVLGSVESIKALTRDQMKAYFDRRYSPNNITLVASGNFNWNEFCRDAATYCSAWQTFETPRSLTRHASLPRQFEYRKPNLNQGHVLLMTEGCGAQDEERFALALLSSITGDSTGSRIYWELVEPGLAESAGAENDERDGLGLFMAYAGTDPVRIDEVSAKLKAIVSTPRNFSDDELERARTRMLSRIALDGEVPMSRLMSLGSEWTYRKRIHNLHEQLERFRKVNRAEIDAALERFKLSNWSEFRLLPAQA